MSTTPIRAVAMWAWSLKDVKPLLGYFYVKDGARHNGAYGRASAFGKSFSIDCIRVHLVKIFYEVAIFFFIKL